MDPTPSACLTDTISKHSTHGVSFNECAVASNKVVSARKEARSAHVEISTMEVQVKKGQRLTAPKPGIPQGPMIAQLSHEVRVCFGLFLHTLSTCLGFRLFIFLSSSFFSLLGVQTPEMAVHSFR